MKGAYDETVDNESAYEMLKKRVEEAAPNQRGRRHGVASADTLGGWLGGGRGAENRPRLARRARAAVDGRKGHHLGRPLGRHLRRPADRHRDFPLGARRK
jgi:hypothetical protein